MLSTSGVPRGAGEGAFGVTPFYDENSVIATKNVLGRCCKRRRKLIAFKNIRAFAAKIELFCFEIIGLIQMLSLIALVARSSSRRNMWEFLSFYL